jgi:hypothetical protein
MTNDADFTRFDRELEDLRNNTDVANLTMRSVVERYVAMMDVLSAVFLLYYEDMPLSDREKMKAAFDELAGTVRVIEEGKDEADKVHTLKPRR